MGDKLRDKVVIVTGSTTGIGEATARQCIAEGAHVMIHGRDEERAQVVATDLGDKSAYYLGDIADPQTCEDLITKTVERFGRVDAVVNNAALTTRSNLEGTDAEVFDRIVAVNLRAPLLIIRAAVPEFGRQGGGAIVNIGSVNGLSGEPNLLAYSVAKGGLITLTRNLANTLATQKIRVNQLSVGWVTTPNEIALKQREGLPEGWEKNVPLSYAPTGRLLIPAEVAAHVVFWISDESAPANGIVYELEQYTIIGRNLSKDFS